MVDCPRPLETPCEYTLVDQKSPVVVEYLQQKQTDRQCQATQEHLESWHELIKSHAHKSSTSSDVFTLGLLRQPQHPVAVQDTGLPLPPHSVRWKMYQSPRGTCLPISRILVWSRREGGESEGPTSTRLEPSIPERFAQSLTAKQVPRGLRLL